MYTLYYFFNGFGFSKQTIGTFFVVVYCLLLYVFIVILYIYFFFQDRWAKCLSLIVSWADGHAPTGVLRKLRSSDGAIESMLTVSFLASHVEINN